MKLCLLELQLTYKILSLKLFGYFFVFLFPNFIIRYTVFMQSLAFSTVESAGTSAGTSTMVSPTMVYIFCTISALWTPTILLFPPKMPLDF